MKQVEQPKETIIYGGAFNPPTRAHQAILQACIDHAALMGADVWLLPSGERADKHIGADRERRLELIRAMCADVALKGVDVSINTSELDRQIVTETYDTVVDLNGRFSNRLFVWVFGSDSIQTMPKWHHGEWLNDNLSMLVVERPGYPLTKLPAHALLLPVHMIKTSSTEVRNRIANNESVDHLVSRSVLHCLEAV